MNRTGSTLLLLGGLLVTTQPVAARAQDVPSDLPVPAIPAAQPQAANPIDTPITGAAIAPSTALVDPGMSMEALMAVRPGYSPKNESGDARDIMVRQAAWAAGARQGLYARQTAIRAMLDHYTPVLDRTFDFRAVLQPIGDGSSLFRPPVVTESQMALALDPSGRKVQESRQVYQIVRQAGVVSQAPNWRTWLVPEPVKPPDTPDEELPRTQHEVEVWREGVAKGWAAGERQGTEIFLDDLGRLQREIVGMARYWVLERAGKMQNPSLTLLEKPVAGDHDRLMIDNHEASLRMLPGMDADRAHWHTGDDTP